MPADGDGDSQMLGLVEPIVNFDSDQGVVGRTERSPAICHLYAKSLKIVTNEIINWFPLGPVGSRWHFSSNQRRSFDVDRLSRTARFVVLLFASLRRSLLLPPFLGRLLWRLLCRGIGRYVCERRFSSRRTFDYYCVSYTVTELWEKLEVNVFGSTVSCNMLCLSK